MTAIAHSAYMTQRHTRVLLRQPWFVAITLVQPIIWLLLFGALFRSVTEIPGFTGGGSYLDYLVPGVVIMTALMSSGWSGMGIIEDMDRGLVDRFLASPVHRSSMIVGRISYEALSLIIQATIIGVSGVGHGRRVRGWHWRLRRARPVRHADRRDVRLHLECVGTAAPAAGVGHRPQHDADAAADLPVSRVHPPGAGAGMDSDRGALQPGQLGDRGRP